MTSETPNMPIMAGIKVKPFKKSVISNVNRGNPNVISTPTVVIISPINRETSPLSRDPLVTRTEQLRPIQASQKYSNDVNCMATSASMGANKMRIIAPIKPPMAATVTSTPRTNPALPFWVKA